MTRWPSRGGRTFLGKPEILFTLLTLLFYADPLLTSKNFSGRDLIAYNLPMEKAVHDAYGRGTLPLWSSEISGGRPLLPNPNAGALYPVRPLLATLPFPLAMRIYPVLHWMAAGVGMILLTRGWGLSAEASLIAAVTYAFSGVGVSEVFYPHVQPGMTLLPWLLWLLARPMRSERKRTILLGLLFGLDLLAGGRVYDWLGPARHGRVDHRRRLFRASSSDIDDRDKQPSCSVASSRLLRFWRPFFGFLTQTGPCWG